MAGARIAVVAAVTITVAVAGGALPALAAFRSSTTSATSVTTATLVTPIGLTAAQGCLSTNHAVDLTWTANTDGATNGYTISRQTSTAWTVIGTVTGVNTVRYRDTGLARNTTYTYAISATRGTWTSPNSTTAIIKTPNTARC